MRMTASPQAPFGLRMPEDIKAWIIARAAENGRSVNAEIVQLLKVERSKEGANA
jgi:hypothetical protein